MRRLWRKAASLLILAGPGLAGDLPVVPVLKVEVGTHTAMIRRLVLDEPHQRVVTGGDDKTVRIWNLHDGELIRTVHLPIGPAHEGQVNGLAVSADGRIIAAGGRTGWDLDGQAWLYLIDAQTGGFFGRIGGLPEIICYLTFSASGEYLAVGLCRDKGLRVYRIRDRAPIFSDMDFRDRIAGMDFARDGRLAVTSYGSDVRVYSAAFQLISRISLEDGTQPTIVRFSPNGESLAIGYLDKPMVTLLNAADLKVTGRRRVEAAMAPSDLPGVAWSADGHYVYAIGGSSHPLNFIWRFSSSETGRGEPLGRAQGRWTALETASDGSLIYAAEDPMPVWGKLASAAASNYERRPPLQDFAKLCGRLQVADDFAVRFTPELPAAHPVRFAPLKHYFGSDDAVTADGERYQTSPSSTPALRTQGWEGLMAPELNNRPLKLDPYEIARCIAVDPLHQRIAMGSEWTLRLFDSEAALLWAIPLSQVVRTVGFTPDGRYAVAGLSDGTLRWFRSSDGAEVAAALLHSDAKNWIVWTPDGYYDSSLEGDNLIGWHVNRGRDHAADFFRAVQFERMLYAPEVIRAAYEEATPRPRRLAKAAFTPSSLIPILPPVVEAHASQSSAGRGVIELDAEFRGGPMRELQVFVNGVPALPISDQSLANPTGNIHRRLEVPIAAGPNEIRAEIATPSAIGIGQARLVGSAGGGSPSADLYILALGANRFDDSNTFKTLRFAAADAAGIVAAAEQAAGGVYRHVHALEISDRTGGVAAKRVTEALRFLEGAGQGDTIILFLASHGISDAQGNYYFVPSDATKEDAERALEGADQVRSLIRWSTFFDLLRMLPGRRIVIVDTCQSGYFGGTFDVTSLAKRSFTSHFALVAASTGEEESQEYPPAGHGLFTYGLLQSWLHPGTERDAGTLDAVFRHAAHFVAGHLDKGIGTQTPQLVAPPPLGDTVLTR